MKTLLSAFQFKGFLLTAFAWGWFEVVAVPKPMLVFFLFLSILLDLITGLIKSWSKNGYTTSVGLRKTVYKLLSYLAVIIGVWILTNLMNLTYDVGFDYVIIVDGTIGFLTFIELYSIFENIYSANPKTLLSRKLIKPILKLLKGKIDGHPIDDLLKKEMDEDEKG